MASLTETAYYSRKIIKYGSVTIVALLIMRSIVISAGAYWRKMHPPPQAAPTVAFGKLPKINFPTRSGLPTISLRTETIEGTFPKLADRIKVYFMPGVSPNLLAIDNAKSFANKLGFSGEPEIINQFTLKYYSENNPKTIVEINSLTKNFTLTYNWKEDVNIINQGNPLPENQAIASAKNLLDGYEVLSDDLVKGEQKVNYLKYNQGNLETTAFFSEANFARVDFYKENLEDIKLLPPNPKVGNVSVTLSASSNSRDSKEVIDIKYINYPVSLTKTATYPLKDVNQAWSQLAEGKGFIANLGNNPDGKIVVRRSFLAYYDSDEPQDFLQPIIVFEGDREFFAYVPAVSDDWIE